jgi:plasmid maintenance system antidote protein VapI
MKKIKIVFSFVLSIDVTVGRIHDIVSDKRSITAQSRLKIPQNTLIPVQIYD